MIGKAIGSIVGAPYWALQKGIDGVMQTAWKGGRNTVEGLRGTTKYWDEDGVQQSLNPGRKLARRLKNNAKGVFTGKEYNMKNQVVGDRNRLASGLHFVGDATFGTVGTAIGWGARGVGLLGIGAGRAAIRPTAAFTGHFVKQGIDYVGDTALGAADIVHNLNKTHWGRGTLFAGGAIGTTAIGAGSHLNSQWGSDGIAKAGMQFYNGQQIESVPGTLSPSNIGVENGELVSQPLDSMGADGDLVFAMHNLR